MHTNTTICTQQNDTKQQNKKVPIRRETDRHSSRKHGRDICKVFTSNHFVICRFSSHCFCIFSLRQSQSIKRIRWNTNSNTSNMWRADHSS